MKLGIPLRTHVWYVDIADAAVCGLVDLGSIRVDPVAITSRALVAERLDGNGASLSFAGSANREQDLVARLVDQSLRRCDVRPQRLAVDRQQQVTFGQVYARTGQRGGGVCIPGIASCNVRDAVRPGVRVEDQVGA